MALGMLRGRVDQDGYRPSLLHRLLSPRGAVGNARNGLGERTFRRPSPIYHTFSHLVPHFFAQIPFYTRCMQVPTALGAVIRVELMKLKRAAPIAEAPINDTPEVWTERVKQFALANGANVVGIARFDPDWNFVGYNFAYKWIVMLGQAMRLDEMTTAPSGRSLAEAMRTYLRGHIAAKRTADWLRRQGWRAEGTGKPMLSGVSMIPAAIAAGLGELGKHGSLINRTHGSMLRLSLVLTDAPLIADGRKSIGVDEFCSSCQLCSNECPPNAIYDAKQHVRGELKWYVDFDKCVPYFNEARGCGICLAVCPWSKPGVSEKLTIKMLRRLERDKKSSTQTERSSGGQ